MNPEADVVPACIPMVAFSFRAEQMRSLEYLMSVPISLPRFWAAVVRGSGPLWFVFPAILGAALTVCCARDRLKFTRLDRSWFTPCG